MSEADLVEGRLGAPLLLAILCVPLIFGLLLLRRGYGRSPRITVLAAAVTAIGVLGRLGP